MKAENKKNEVKPTASNIIMSKIDIKAGDMTFGQRIELGKIFSGSDSDILKFERVFVCLHKFKPTLKNYIKLAQYYESIIAGMVHWIEIESKLLKYDPTPEEKQAGIFDLSKTIGEQGTVKALAKAYSQDPDVILEWSYAKVFGILFTDLEESKFQRRYNKVIERKK